MGSKRVRHNLMTDRGRYEQIWAVKVKVTHSCPTFFNSMDYSVHGLLQARILEWEAVPFSRGSSQTQGLNPGLPHCRWMSSECYLFQIPHFRYAGMHLFLFFICFCYRASCCCYNQPARLLMHLTWAGSDCVLPTSSLCLCLSRVQLFVTPWEVARQPPPSMGLSRQECWSGLSCPPQEGGPHPRIQPSSVSCVSCIAGGFFTAEPPGKPCSLPLFHTKY